jgi:hypothetical protein
MQTLKAQVGLNSVLGWLCTPQGLKFATQQSVFTVPSQHAFCRLPLITTMLCSMVAGLWDGALTALA